MRYKRIELSYIRILSARETIYQYISRARIKIRKDSLSLPFRFYSVKFSFHFAIMLEQELNAESVKFIAVLFRVLLNICFWRLQPGHSHSNRFLFGSTYLKICSKRDSVSISRWCNCAFLILVMRLIRPRSWATVRLFWATSCQRA